VGIDDTDSPRGGCTTHFALEAAGALRREHGLVLRGYPRLVRLNPNVPWKTRGNAAVALELGVPKAAGELVGVTAGGEEVRASPGAGAARPAAKHLETLEALVAKWCDLGQEGTDPAFVLCAQPLPERFYEEAVKGIVDPAAVRRHLRAQGKVLWKAHGDGRGIVGAAAAVAYPAREPTFEIITYREQARWGTKRAVDPDSVDQMDRAYPATYHNIDRANRHLSIVPSTPCPLLFGVRATSPHELKEAAATVRAGEPWSGWMLFATNQGTDAHVVESTVERAEPMVTVRMEGKVARQPRRIVGGHVLFPLEGDAGGKIDCAAYEPTKAFREVVAALRAGDRVRAVGAVREDRRTVNLEKLEIVSTQPRLPDSVNPPCPKCGTRMKSAGARAPYRCRKCGAKREKSGLPPGAPLAGPKLGWYEVPIAARRHLARPIDPHGYGDPAA
jgi:tRNA(Ile2)-agmatinylcytidine synthase